LSQFDTVAAKLRQSLVPGCITTRSCPSPTKGGQGVWGKANARGRSRRCARLSFAARQLKSVGELHLSPPDSSRPGPDRGAFLTAVFAWQRASTTSLLPCDRLGLFGALIQRSSAIRRPHDGIGCALGNRCGDAGGNCGTDGSQVDGTRITHEVTPQHIRRQGRGARRLSARECASARPRKRYDPRGRA
jgi:hypothetical protein